MLIISEKFRNSLLPMHGYMKGGGDGGAGAQADATREATALQREIWQTTMNNLAPFTPMAQQYIGQMQNLSTLEGQGNALNQYYNSQQFNDLANQARYQQLAGAEAMGGLGSTATSNQLASIAPMLGQSWLSDQMNNYQNLANIGLGACKVRQTQVRVTPIIQGSYYNRMRQLRRRQRIDRLGCSKE